MSFCRLIMMMVTLAMASSVHAAEQPAVPKLATQVCAACHGADGNSAVAMYPKIAGQFKPYTAKQLTEFKSGVRKSPVMTPSLRL